MIKGADQLELLELAAKAIGLDYWIVKTVPRGDPWYGIHYVNNGQTEEFNSLDNPLDAFKLQVKLCMNVDVYTMAVVVKILDTKVREYFEENKPESESVCLAITKAAAKSQLQKEQACKNII